MSAEQSKEYYEKLHRESVSVLSTVFPSIALDTCAAILVWLFGRLVFVPIARGLFFYGYPLPQIINFIILVALVVIVLRVLVDIRRGIDASAAYISWRVGSPYKVTPEEVEHYRTALRGIFYIIAVSLMFLLFVDYLSAIHPALSGVVLLIIVVWAIYQIWRVVQAVSAEIRRYTSEWAKRTLGSGGS